MKKGQTHRVEVVSKIQMLREDICLYILDLGFLNYTGISIFSFPLISPEKVPLKLEILIAKDMTLITFYQSEFDKNTFAVSSNLEEIKKEISNQLKPYIEKKAGSLKLLYEKL